VLPRRVAATLRTAARPSVVVRAEILPVACSVPSPSRVGSARGPPLARPYCNSLHQIQRLSPAPTTWAGRGAGNSGPTTLRAGSADYTAATAECVCSGAGWVCLSVLWPELPGCLGSTKCGAEGARQDEAAQELKHSATGGVS
jgi:hypothetical protein